MKNVFRRFIFAAAVILFGGVGVMPILAADGTFYAVTYPAPTNPAPGELVYAAEWRIWIPPVETLRSVVVHQHGCGDGSCNSGRTAVDDLHWQALARKHDSALIGVSYRQTGECSLWCDPRNGSEQSFLHALADFARQSGHPELTVIPWALWGHSGGGHWSGCMVQLHPDRIVGAWLRSGHPDTVGLNFAQLPLTQEVLGVPILFNIGTTEFDEIQRNNIWKGGFSYVAALRSRGGKIGFLIDPHTQHETGDSRYPAIRFLDECLTARLPVEAGTVRLRPAQEGVILAADSADERVRAELPDGFWLPSEGFVKVWQRYTADSSFDDSTPPPVPTEVAVSDDGVMTWKAEADMESGLAGFVIRKGDVTLAVLPEGNRNPFGRNLFQGLSYSDTPVPPLAEMTFVIPDYRVEEKSDYSVATLNTCGLESDPAAAK